eukprot:scaffold766_cov210-Alexandrium_tamarense.AAC.2
MEGNVMRRRHLHFQDRARSTIKTPPYLSSTGTEGRPPEIRVCPHRFQHQYPPPLYEQTDRYCLEVEE